MGNLYLPHTMLVPKANRQAVYKYLFKEGVMVAKKDFNKKSHDDPDLEGVPNLHVIKLMQSLKSRGYVEERFSWRWYYYYLTNEGIDYLQKFLNLPADVVPATLKKTSRPARPESGGKGGKGGYGRDDGYRGRGGYGDKAGAPGGEYRPSFGGGRGGGSF